MHEGQKTVCIYMQISTSIAIGQRYDRLEKALWIGLRLSHAKNMVAEVGLEPT